MRFSIAFFYCFFYSCVFLQAQEDNTLSFSAIREELFNGWISSITQDSKGFIWIGTQDGLHRYDGYKFEVLRNSPEDSQSLGANWVKGIFIDTNDDHWLTTFGNGLTKFSPKTMNFKNFSNDSFSEFPGKVTSGIIPLGRNHMIMATDEGFILFDAQNPKSIKLKIGGYESPMTSNGNTAWLLDSHKLYSYSLETKKLNRLYDFGEHVQFIKYVDEIGLVIGLDHKVVLFNNGKIIKELATDETITKFASNGKESYILSSDRLLFTFLPEEFQIKPLSSDLDFSEKKIRTIYLDRQSNLWVGTTKGLYKEKKTNPGFLPKKVTLHARRILKTKNKLYIGGNKGLFKIQKESTQTVLRDISILSLLNTSNGLYCSGDTAEIYQFVNDSLKTTIPLSAAPGKKLRTMGLAMDQQKRLWVGSWEGLFIFDQQHQLLNFLPLDTGFDSKEAKIIEIHIDTKDRLWIITSAYGIFKIPNASKLYTNSFSSTIVNYKRIKGDQNSLTSNIVTAMGEDQQGNMWFGTDIGVLKYQEETQNFARLKYQGTLFDKKVMSLRASGDQNLWITTINSGIYKYDSADKTIQHFTKKDGLISNAFLYSSGFFDKNANILYFGTDEGVQEIDASQSFSLRKEKAPIITAFTINGSDSKTGIAPPQAPFLKDVSLAFDQNDFSVNFSVMNYVNPARIKYSYALDNNNWRIADLQTAYFTNVPFGNHVLKVRAINDGITNNKHVSRLNIYIQPPWYLSFFAKIVYFLLCVAAIIGIYTYLKWRWKMQFNLKIKEEEVVRFKKLNDFKSNLYTNIAHEFKTPLTLISGPIDHKLQEGNISNADFDNFSMVKRNTERLTNLVDQVLALAKLENGKLQMKISKGNLGLFLHSISQSFEYQAQQKKIDYTVKIDAMDYVSYDADILEKIVTNLLSNALKYCPEKGKCSLLATKSTTHLFLHVKNTTSNGSQINLKKLFTRFYQQDSFAEGVGVGLALVKELIDFYKGEINTSMEVNEIIHFQVKLPLHSNTVEAKHNEISSSVLTGINENQKKIVLDENVSCRNLDNLPILLIVEDNFEIRSFIKNSFKNKYHILEAENGEKGYEIALSKIPDIIISDVRMPILDGIQLCNAIKKDARINHIPIILLTAGSGEENELKGLASGADAFVTKPFKTQLLEQRISNLIAIRKALRERYSQALILKPKDIAISSSDEVFLNSIQKILDEHLSNPTFNAVSFSKKAAMSRMQLHRKLQTYTGLSTSAFIRSQRLKLASDLLLKNELTINEIAYSCGFNTPSYFMKCFKAQFQLTPSEFSAQKKVS